MREVQFPKAPSKFVELQSEQLGGALQVIAALVLTPEEGAALCEENAEWGTTPEWIASMKEQLLSPEWRPLLLKALTHQGFLTNTHPGFPLRLLAEGPVVSYSLRKSYELLEALLQAYGKGEGDDAPKDYRAYWASRLVEKGVSQEMADWTLKYDGAMLACDASLNRRMAELDKLEKTS